MSLIEITKNALTIVKQGYCKDNKGQDHMSVYDMMEVDGVHGQARMTFTGTLTAVPTGCYQATVGPD